MSLDAMFTLELLLVAVVVVVIVAGALFISLRARRIRHQTAAESEPLTFPWARQPTKKRVATMSSPEERRLVGRRDGFVAALKAYRMMDDGWHDYSPRRAADVLELASEDYEIDEERSALLLRRLPPRLPTEARDVL